MKLSFLKNTTLILVSFLPLLSRADLVPCTNDCDFLYFVQMINGIINWIISISVIIFTISLIYGGFLYLTSGEKPSQKEDAKKIMLNTLYGFLIILASWLIVYTILINLVPKSSTIFNFIKK